ncbi:MAG: hypothetical protein WKI04_03780 [Ferruginibacter sp.]
MIAFVNNQFFDEDKATLQISDLAIQRGYGVFDFLERGATSRFSWMITCNASSIPRQ